MRHALPLLLLSGLLASGLALATPGSAAPATAARHTLHASRGDQLSVGQRLTSSNGNYIAGVQRSGRLVVHNRRGTVLWHTVTHHGSHPHLRMRHGGQVVLVAGKIVRWSTHTAGAGHHVVLTMRNSGTLALTYGTLLVWSSRVGSSCPHTDGKTFTVDLSQQRARACRNGQQIRVTRVTTGASARGNGTPTGSWRVQARVRNTTLYPAAGGAYPVRYWMPYDGAYGIHDSPWQRFPYGSARYRTHGSHGCTHVPGPMMGWLFRWAPVGTRISIVR